MGSKTRAGITVERWLPWGQVLGIAQVLGMLSGGCWAGCSRSGRVKCVNGEEAHWSSVGQVYSEHLSRCVH